MFGFAFSLEGEFNIQRIEFAVIFAVKAVMSNPCNFSFIVRELTSIISSVEPTATDVTHRSQFYRFGRAEHATKVRNLFKST